MTGRSPAPGLLTLSRAAREVLAALRSAGGRPLLVGGCVRDALLLPGSAPSDVDIEVHDGPEWSRLAAQLSRIARVDDVGRSFGVLKVSLGGEAFDVSVPRAGGTGRDGERAASAARDFTINALMVDPATEELVDHHGGVADLRAGVLRAVGPAFADDPLRVLRGVQFAARFGFRMDDATAQLCRSLVDRFAELPRDRVWGEWRTLAATGRDLTGAVETLEATGWMAAFPELGRCRGVAQDPAWHPEGDVLTHLGLAADRAAQLADADGLTGDDRVVVVLAALLHDIGKVEHTQHRADGRITSYGHAEGGVAPARALLDRIGAPGWVAERLAPLVREHMCSITSPLQRSSVRRLARRLRPATIAEWALVVEADKSGRGAASRSGTTSGWLALADELGVVRDPEPPLLLGRHLIAAGMTPGPDFRAVLAAAARAQEDGTITDLPSALAWLAAR